VQDIKTLRDVNGENFKHKEALIKTLRDRIFELEENKENIDKNEKDLQESLAASEAQVKRYIEENCALKKRIEKLINNKKNIRVD